MRRRFLYDAIAPDAAELEPNDADHLETRRYVFQGLGNIRAQNMEHASAIGICILFRCVCLGFRVANGPVVDGELGGSRCGSAAAWP